MGRPKIATTEKGSLQCWYSSSSSRELKRFKITDDEDNNKSPIELRLTEPLLIKNKRGEFIS